MGRPQPCDAEGPGLGSGMDREKGMGRPQPCDAEGPGLRWGMDRPSRKGRCGVRREGPPHALACPPPQKGE
eukprot:7231703-Prymnesium_polylepis.1